MGSQAAERQASTENEEIIGSRHLSPATGSEFGCSK